MTSPDSRAELIAEGRRRLDAFESATPGSQEEMDAADSWNVWQLVNGEKLLDALEKAHATIKWIRGMAEVLEAVTWRHDPVRGIQYTNGLNDAGTKILEALDGAQ